MNKKEKYMMCIDPKNLLKRLSEMSAGISKFTF